MKLLLRQHNITNIGIKLTIIQRQQSDLYDYEKVDPDGHVMWFSSNDRVYIGAVYHWYDRWLGFEFFSWHRNQPYAIKTFCLL